MGNVWRPFIPRPAFNREGGPAVGWAVSYTHLRAHETLRYLVCRLLLEKKLLGKIKLKFGGPEQLIEEAKNLQKKVLLMEIENDQLKDKNVFLEKETRNNANTYFWVT